MPIEIDQEALLRGRRSDGIVWEEGQAGPNPIPALALLGCLSLAGYVFLAKTGDLREHLPRFLTASCLLALIYLAALIVTQRGRRRPASVWIVLAGGLIFRLVMLIAPPSLSDDIHRYVRDGWVQVNGVNPYAAAPDDPALERLRLPDHHLINNPSVPTIYPPLAQMIFAIAAFLSRSTVCFKAVFLLFEAACMGVLMAWLRALGRNPAGVIVYAWHPLAVVEGAGSGHVDIVGAFFLVLAVWLIIGDRKFASSAAVAASVLTKLLPIVLLPLFVRSLKLRHLCLLAALLIVLAAPYLSGAGGHMFTGLAAYSSSWEFNGSLYPLIEAGVEALHPTEALKSALTSVKHALRDPVFLDPLYGWLHPPYLARALAAILGVAALVWIALGSLPFDREVLFSIGVVLLLSPTVHPWYLLWLLPFLAIWMSPAWLWLSLTIPFSYLAVRDPGGGVALSVWIIEYVPMLPIAALGWWWSRRGSAPHGRVPRASSS